MTSLTYNSIKDKQNLSQKLKYILALHQVKYKGLDNFQCDQQDGDAGEIRTPDRRLRRPHRRLSQPILGDNCGNAPNNCNTY